jgi:NADH-quinone oxidoreductase subunit H
LLFGLIWLRATLPRFRYDRLMEFGWKTLLPLSLANVFLTGVAVVFADQLQIGGWLVIGFNLLVFVLALALTGARLRGTVGQSV